MYQLNWKKKNELETLAPDLYFIHRLILEICKFHFLFWFVFGFCCFFLWLIPEWGRFLVRLRAGAILRHGLLSI